MRLLIFLMSDAVIGLIFLQLYWITESWELKSQLFDRSVNEALNAVSQKIEKAEAVKFIAAKAEALEKTRRSPARLRKAPENPVQPVKPVREEREVHVEMPEMPPFPPVPAMPGITFKRKLNIDSIVFNVDSLLRAVNFTWTDSVITHMPMLGSKHRLLDTAHTRIIVYADKNGSIIKLRDSKHEEQKERVKEPGMVKDYLERVTEPDRETKVFEDLADEMRKLHADIRQRVQPHTVDSLLKQELSNRGITLPYQYRVYRDRTDSLIFTNASLHEKQEHPDYRTPLFPSDFFRETAYLTVDFPGKDHYLLKKMTFVMASSAGLILIIISGFAWTIFSILKQKKISQMKTDFINNMTHEFKTPVSTIMLASEALKEETEPVDKQRIHKLAQVIYEENLRLSDHVERVLNLAAIEKEQFKLEMQQVNVHEVIRKAIEAMRMQFEQRDANVEFIPEAADPVLLTDPLHFSNVIMNLLDNALKYCDQVPHITIRTRNIGKIVYLSVEDNGIGMTGEQQKRIFEQFYRVPTGNIHNVKGFGLGLNYVQQIVRRMNGKICVTSEKNKGSKFELCFPC